MQWNSSDNSPDILVLDSISDLTLSFASAVFRLIASTQCIWFQELEAVQVEDSGTRRASSAISRRDREGELSQGSIDLEKLMPRKLRDRNETSQLKKMIAAATLRQLETDTRDKLSAVMYVSQMNFLGGIFEYLSGVFFCSIDSLIDDSNHM